MHHHAPHVPNRDLTSVVALLGLLGVSLTLALASLLPDREAGQPALPQASILGGIAR